MPLYDTLLPGFARGLSVSLNQLVGVHIEGSLKNSGTAEPLQVQSEGMVSTGTQERYEVSQENNQGAIIPFTSTATLCRIGL
jgi:hypothetical protein